MSENPGPTLVALPKNFLELSEEERHRILKSLLRNVKRREKAPAPGQGSSKPG